MEEKLGGGGGKKKHHKEAQSDVDGRDECASPLGSEEAS